MSARLFSVTPDTPLDAVHRLLEERSISSVPVIDGGGALRGIVSTRDLLREAHARVASPHDPLKLLPSDRLARDVMRASVATIDEGAPIRDAAKQMLAARIHRLVVTRNGKPAAIVSTRDAMAAVVLQRVQTPLGTVMTAPVLTVDLGDSIEEAVARLDETNVHGLVVLDGRWPVGVFTQAEALRALALPPGLRRAPVEELMSYETICQHVSTPLYRVAAYAMKLCVRRILAVQDRDLRGILTGFDLLRVMAAD